LTSKNNLLKKNFIVETINLTKKYGDITAVNNLNLQVEEGTVFGLLGPNGAGKTTTILMLLGLTEPSSGQAFVAGYDSTRNPIQVKSIVGYLPDNVGFYEEMTGIENLLYTAALNGIPKNQAKIRIEQALERVGLKDTGKRRVGEYSRGMRQRLGIADVLVKDPKLIIMDEPTLGIDPEGIHDLLNLIKDLAQQDGRTILISSHLLHQIQKICDKVGIFVEGKLMASGTIDELQHQLAGGSDHVEIELKTVPFDDGLLKICQKINGVLNYQWSEDYLLLQCEQDVREELSKKLYENNYLPLHLQLRGISLDSIYLRYFQKEEGYGGGFS